MLFHSIAWFCISSLFARSFAWFLSTQSPSQHFALNRNLKCKGIQFDYKRCLFRWRLITNVNNGKCRYAISSETTCNHPKFCWVFNSPATGSVPLNYFIICEDVFTTPTPKWNSASVWGSRVPMLSSKGRENLEFWIAINKSQSIVSKNSPTGIELRHLPARSTMHAIHAR